MTGGLAVVASSRVVKAERKTGRKTAVKATAVMSFLKRVFMSKSSVKQPRGNRR
jgi:hypothetical protein